MKSAAAKIEKDAIWIREVISGRLKMRVANKSEKRNEAKEKANPRKISNIVPAAIMFLIFVGLFSSLYWDVYFMVAWLN